MAEGHFREVRSALVAGECTPHLALVFGLSHTTASTYAFIACDLLAGQSAEAGRDAGFVPGRDGAARQKRQAVDTGSTTVLI